MVVEHHFGIHYLHAIDIQDVNMSDVIKSPSMLMHFLLNMIRCAFFLFQYYSAIPIRYMIPCFVHC